MVERTAVAEWRGGLEDGQGMMAVGSGGCRAAYTFGTRFGSVAGTNPEELLGAAHAGCFSMALSLLLGEAGLTPRDIHTRAAVTIEPKNGGFQITHIHLDTEAAVRGAAPEKFREIAEAARRGCPVSQALADTDIMLSARLTDNR